jgi:uncharacterized membrane protein (UPF0127 family)
MMNRILYHAVALSLLLIFAYATYTANMQSASNKAATQLDIVPSNPARCPISFAVDNKSFAISSCQITEQELERGLMNATVTNKTFMLFVFGNEGIYPFWMKNTYYPLDQIWISSNGTIGRIAYIAHAVPCIDYDKAQLNCPLYVPNATADYVIEASSGFTAKYGVHVGSAVSFNYG